MYLDNYNIVNILDNKIGTDSVDLVNPLTGKSIGRQYMDPYEILQIRRLKTMKAYFEAPADSYLNSNNNILENSGIISKPNLENLPYTSLPSENRTPSIPLDISTISPEKSGFRFHYPLNDPELDSIDPGVVGRIRNIFDFDENPFAQSNIKPTLSVSEATPISPKSNPVIPNSKPKTEPIDTPIPSDPQWHKVDPLLSLSHQLLNCPILLRLSHQQLNYLELIGILLVILMILFNINPHTNRNGF